MKTTALARVGLLFSLHILAGTNPSQHDQVEMNKHIKVAKHAVAQPAVNSQKELDKKSAQSK